MKRLIFLSTLLIFVLSVSAQPLLIPKGIKALTYTITQTEISYLHGLSGNVESNFLKISDGVLGSTLYYDKDTIDNKLNKKLNVYQPVITNGTANTLPVGTNTTGLATTAFVSGEIVNKRDGVLKQLQSLGASIKAIPWNCTLYSAGNFALTDGTLILVLLDDVTESTVATGIKSVATATTGNFTADNFCGAALFSVSNGVYTQIAISANLPDQMKLAANTAALYPFTAPITIQPGKYVAALLYNSSAQTTAPSVYSCSATINGIQGGIGLTVARICCSLPSQSTMPSSVTASTTTFSSNTPFLFLY